MDLCQKSGIVFLSKYVATDLFSFPAPGVSKNLFGTKELFAVKKEVGMVVLLNYPLCSSIFPITIMAKNASDFSWCIFSGFHLFFGQFSCHKVNLVFVLKRAEKK